MSDSPESTNGQGSFFPRRFSSSQTSRDILPAPSASLEPPNPATTAQRQSQSSSATNSFPTGQPRGSNPHAQTAGAPVLHIGGNPANIQWVATTYSIQHSYLDPGGNGYIVGENRQVISRGMHVPPSSNSAFTVSGPLQTSDRRFSGPQGLSNMMNNTAPNLAHAPQQDFQHTQLPNPHARFAGNPRQSFSGHSQAMNPQSIPPNMMNNPANMVYHNQRETLVPGQYIGRLGQRAGDLGFGENAVTDSSAPQQTIGMQSNPRTAAGPTSMTKNPGVVESYHQQTNFVPNRQPGSSNPISAFSDDTRSNMLEPQQRVEKQSNNPTASGPTEMTNNSRQIYSHRSQATPAGMQIRGHRVPLPQSLSNRPPIMGNSPQASVGRRQLLLNQSPDSDMENAGLVPKKLNPAPVSTQPKRTPLPSSPKKVNPAPTKSLLAKRKTSPSNGNKTDTGLANSPPVRPESISSSPGNGSQIDASPANPLSRKMRTDSSSATNGKKVDGDPVRSDQTSVKAEEESSEWSFLNHKGPRLRVFNLDNTFPPSQKRLYSTMSDETETSTVSDAEFEARYSLMKRDTEEDLSSGNETGIAGGSGRGDVSEAGSGISCGNGGDGVRELEEGRGRRRSSTMSHEADQKKHQPSEEALAAQIYPRSVPFIRQLAQRKAWLQTPEDWKLIEGWDLLKL